MGVALFGAQALENTGGKVPGSIPTAARPSSTLFDIDDDADDEHEEDYKDDKEDKDDRGRG